LCHLDQRDRWINPADDRGNVGIGSQSQPPSSTHHRMDNSLKSPKIDMKLTHPTNANSQESKRGVQCEIHHDTASTITSVGSLRIRRRRYEYNSTIEIDFIILLEW
jgi:hypothetical protein